MWCIRLTIAMKGMWAVFSSMVYRESCLKRWKIQIRQHHSSMWPRYQWRQTWEQRKI